MSSLPAFLRKISNKLENIYIQKDKVLKLFRTLDSKKAHSCHRIPIAMTKICYRSIVDPLFVICKKSLRFWIYPSSWKKANIIPVYIKESRQRKKNYRPVSSPPIFGKISETLLFDDIYENFECYLSSL